MKTAKYILLFILCVGVVNAIPSDLTVHGWGIRDNDNLINGNHNLTVRIYYEFTGGSQQFTQSYVDKDFYQGQIDVILYDISGLDTSEDWYLEVQVNASTISPRFNITSTVQALVVEAINWSDITSIPADLDLDSTDDITTSNIADQTVNQSSYLGEYQESDFQRVLQNCSSGYSIREVLQDGTVVCEQDSGEANCDGASCDVTNTGTLDGYEASDLLDDTFNTTQEMRDAVNNTNMNITINASLVQDSPWITASDLIGIDTNITDTDTFNTTFDITRSINESSINLTNAVTMPCNQILFDNGLGSAEICDGLDAAGGGGSGAWITDKDYLYNDTTTIYWNISKAHDIFVNYTDLIGIDTNITDTDTFNTTEEMEDAVGDGVYGGITYDDGSGAFYLNITWLLENGNVNSSMDLVCTDCIDGTEIAELSDADISDTLTASTWDSETSQSDLNVNSSDYWDSLDDPSDINAADITDDDTYATTASEETFDETVTFTKNITQGDNDMHCFGDSLDACLYWNGSAFIIE